MIRFEITAQTPTEYREAIWMLVNGISRDALNAALPEPRNQQAETYASGGLTREKIEAALAEARAEMDAISNRGAVEPSPAPDAAAVQHRNEAAAEARTRKPRTPKETPAAAPAISTGEERVDPQDTADEAAEAEAARAANGGKLTLGDVRQLSGVVYKGKYGVEAVVKDIQIILGHGISQIPDTQEAISAAMAKIQHAIDHGRPTQPEAPKPDTPPQPEQKASEPAAPETSGLFGDPTPPAAEPVKTATVGDFKQVCMDYSKKYDPKMATDPMKSTIMQEDVKKITMGAVGTVDQRAVMGDAANIYEVVAAVKKALEENPFKR